MADYGAKHICFCKNEQDAAGVVLGKLVQANLTLKQANGELYADDGLAESVTEFVSGDLKVQTDDLIDENASVIYGSRIENGELIDNTGDAAPEGGIAYYKVKMRKGVKKFCGIFFPRTKAALGNDNAQTKGSNITLSPTETGITVMAPDSGDWRYRATFDNEQAAIDWVETKTKIKNAHKITVVSQGAGVGEGVSPGGISMVTNNGTFVLTVTGHAAVTAAYDNNSNVTTTITDGDGTYTVANVTEDHAITIVF